MISTWAWVELWFVVAGPFVLYLATSYYAYQLQHKRVTATVHWRWSFLHLQLAVAGVCLLRMKAMVILWYAGMAHASSVVDPEWAAAGWAVSLGLFGHVYLLNRHPAWDRPDVGENI